MPQLALVRHGQSLWNLENRFTGWVDVPLTPKGEDEARAAGRTLQSLEFQVAYTSLLQRAAATLAIMLDVMGTQLPVIRDEALNERHYGELQGLNKAEAAHQFGADQVHQWRRSYDVSPPNGESLRQTAVRTLPFFERCILGDVALGKNVLVVAHGNSNRSIVMQLDQLDEHEVLDLEIPTGVPLLYDLGTDGTVQGKRVLDLLVDGEQPPTDPSAGEGEGRTTEETVG